MIQITITNNQATLVEINKDWTNASGPYHLYLTNGLSQETFKAENLTDQGNGYVFKFMVDFEGKIKNSGQYNLILCDSEGINIVNDIANIEVQRTEDPDDVEPDDFYYEADQEPIIIDGPQGIQGIQGVQGNTGIQGAQGEAVQGEIGPQGVQGETGIQGPQGLNGESFPAWFGTKEEYDAIPVKDPLVTYYVQDVGINWFGTQEEYDAIVDKDPDVIYFVQGEGGSGGEGSQGAQGVQGAQGEKGDKGDKGDTGSQGAQGEKGEAGEQGPKGDKGDKGNTGSQGVQGAQGVQGIQGNDGAQGPQGLNGLMEQADWNEQTSTNPSYIKNKPTIPTKTSDLQNDSGFINTTTNRDVLGCNVYYFSNTPDANNRLIITNSGGLQRAINSLGANMTFGLYSNITVPMLNLKLSFDGGSTFYRVEQHAQSLSFMDWSWYAEQTLYLRVNNVATTDTEGILRIVGMDDAYLTSGLENVYKNNPFRNSARSGYKVIKSANTANGIEAIAFKADSEDVAFIYKPSEYKQISNGTFRAMLQPQRGRTVDANNTITRYIPFTDEVFRTIYMNTAQDASTGNIVLDTNISEFTQGDIFWIYTNRSYGPLDSIHVSFDNGTTYYDFSRFGETTNMGFNIPKHGKLLVQVVKLPTSSTNGVLRIISYEFNDVENANYASMWTHTNIPNSNTGDVLKMVTATNTNNGRIGFGVHPSYDAFEFIYKPEAYKDQSSGRVVAQVRPSRGQTIGSSDNIVRDVAFVDEIPTKTSDLTNDSGFTTFSGNYNDLTNKPTIPQGTFETWTFTLEDNTTVTKSVFIGS